MSDRFLNLLKCYAELIVRYGLNVQAGQQVYIATESYHKNFALLVAESAYAHNAKYVSIDLQVPELTKVMLEQGQSADFSFVPGYMGSKFTEFVEQQVCFCRILGPENPLVLNGQDPQKLSEIRSAKYNSMKNFYVEGIGKSKVQWTVAAAATPAWAARVFGETASSELTDKLWDVIFKLCRVDQEDSIQAWTLHNAKLKQRASTLNEMGLQCLRFEGPGTEFKVGLSELARFKGGSDSTHKGVEFEPNLPTEEVFTTPDWRSTEGKVAATRPFFVNGTLVEGLCMEFKAGNLIDFSATKGAKAFQAHIDTDPGAKRLGEVALVGIDSPVFQSGLVFEEILFDENAACHIAIGSAYKFCLEGGSELSEGDLQHYGCNESAIHTDIMISSPAVSVFGVRPDGSELAVICDGLWQI